MIIEKIRVSVFFTNCYIIGCEKEKLCGIIDPGDETEKIKEIIAKFGLKPTLIINTHGHFDHIGGNNFFDLPVYIHEYDAEFLKNPDKNLSSLFSTPYICKNKVITFQEGEKIKIGKLTIDIIHTPGHTPGSVCLKFNNILFTGDTLFRDGIGRTDFPGGNEKELIKSIREKILILPEDTKIYPGHGEKSNIGNIKKWLNFS